MLKPTIPVESDPQYTEKKKTHDADMRRYQQDNATWGGDIRRNEKFVPKDDKK